LVDRGTWEAVQRALRQRTKTRRGRRPVEDDPFILRGLLRCATCGGMLATHVAKGRTGPVRYYACLCSNPRIARQLHRAVCTFGRVPAVAVEGYIWGVVSAALLEPDSLRLGLAAAQAKHATA